MADEQLLILKMLEDGKITAEQATELLTLIGKRSPSRVNPSQLAESRRVQRELRQEERRVLRQQARSLREEERQVRRQIKREAKRYSDLGQTGPADSLGRTVQNSLFMLGLPLGGGRSFVFTKELDGKFVGERPEIGVRNTNGRIVIENSQDDRWHLRLTVRVRADGADEARGLAESLVSVKHADTALSVESKRLFGQNAGVDIDLLLPCGIRPRLQASCTNGTINLIGITGEKLVLHTVNGKVKAQEFQTESIEAHSVNGGIWLAGAGQQIKCRAANGRIQLLYAGESSARVELETVNGAIDVSLPLGEQVGYQVDAASTAGAVEVNLPNVLREGRTRPGRRSVQAESRDLKSKSLVQSVQAKSVSGRITIQAEGGVRKNV